MAENSHVSLPVSRRNQETNLWCWAASGEMVMDFLGTNVTQCDQANRRFGFTECCQSPVASKCVMGGWPEFTKYGFRSSRTSRTALTWGQVVDQISTKGVPFAFTWAWNGGGGHMMVAYGYAIVDGRQYVLIHDPWPPNVGSSKTIPYDEYVSGSHYTHWDDFYDIERAEPFGGETLHGGLGMGHCMDPGQSDAITSASSVAQLQLGTARNLLFGGSAPGGSETLSLGQGFAVSVFGLDELQSIAKTPSAGAVMLERDPALVVFAISDGSGATQGEMSLKKTATSWGGATVGTSDLVRRAQEVLPPSASAQSQSMIWIPALNLQFLQTEDGGQSKYLSLVEDASFPMGSQFSAEDLYLRLVSAAQSHDSQPR